MSASGRKVIPGKHPDLRILNDRPLNAETPAHLLDDRVTPAELLFIRNNGLPPAAPNPNQWTLRVDGESVGAARSWSLQALQSEFKHYTYQLTLECGGNGRAEFNPPARGNQWTTGAVSCANWTGVRLQDILKACDVKDDAVYVAYYGSDTHLSGDAAKDPISRGIPLAKALENESLVAWAGNDQPLPLQNGFPLRLVVGGWPASVSGKWLTRLRIRNRVHDGAKMGGYSYRVPRTPVAPGAAVSEQQMVIIESMPVKSLVTFPRSGTVHERRHPLYLRGHAWAGDRSVRSVAVSTDFGATWQATDLEKPVNRFAWQHWQTAVSFEQTGYFEVWARAIDDAGQAQPMVVPGWNPRGYLNNACHRIAVQVV